MRIDPNIEIRRHLEQNLTRVVQGKGDQQFTPDEVEIAKFIRAPRGVILGGSIESSFVIGEFASDGIDVFREELSHFSLGTTLDLYVDIDGLDLSIVPENVTQLCVELYIDEAQVCNENIDIADGVLRKDGKLDFVCSVLVPVSAADITADDGCSSRVVGARLAFVSAVQTPTVECLRLYGSECAFRIRATKQFDTDALRYSSETQGADSDDIDLRNSLNDDYQITFHEWRGRRHSYLPIVESHFVFECYGPVLEHAHTLFELIDKFLHDPCPGTGSREILFGDLYIYSSLRARLPELYLELESRGVGLPQFAVAYRLIYSEQEA